MYARRDEVEMRPGLEMQENRTRDGKSSVALADGELLSAYDEASSTGSWKDRQVKCGSKEQL